MPKCKGTSRQTLNGFASDLRQLEFDASNSNIQINKLSYVYASFNSTPNIRPGQIDLYDFDRCAGTLSNYKQVLIDNLIDTLNAVSVCFSPNNRFLYVSDNYKIWQLDLNTANILKSRIMVGARLVGNNYGFYEIKNAVDGKIYVAGGACRYLHVINSPDSFGLACNFVQKQIDLGVGKYSTGGLPNEPNFALGAINCSIGIENVNTENDGFNIYPNPTHSSFTINFSNDWNNAAIKVFNLTGQIIFEKQNQNGKQFPIDLSNQSAGIYFIEVQTATNIYRSKVVKE